MGFQKTWALIVGIILAIIGVWGLFTTSILGIGVNMTQSIIHLIGAIFGIYVGLKGTGKTFNMVVGVLGLILGILGFIPGAKDLMMSLLNCNMATHILHLAVGIVSLIIYFAVKEQAEGTAAPF
ncbi:MAG: DUF4383 domain-containing protein [Nanoarchaeota archaeon]